MRKPRAANLTDETIELVLDRLDSWSEKLTWEALISKIKSETGHEYSRFTFADYPQVVDAFSLKKKALSGKLARPPLTPRDSQVQAALAQVERFRAKAERLAHVNALLNEQFVTWAQNANRFGITKDQLNAPLSLPPREQSKIRR
jgi:hypothetical protein